MSILEINIFLTANVFKFNDIESDAVGLIVMIKKE